MIPGYSWASLLLTLTSGITWHSVRPGLERAEFPFGQGGLAAQIHVIALCAHTGGFACTATLARRDGIATQSEFDHGPSMFAEGSQGVVEQRFRVSPGLRAARDSEHA